MAKEKKKEIKKDYKEWLEAVKKDEKLKQKKLLILEKAGFPTELKTHHILSKLGYRTGNMRYAISEKSPAKTINEFGNQETKYSELDIKAYKLFKEIKLGPKGNSNSTIAFYINLIGDCKYFGKENLIAFKDKKKDNYLQIPLFLNGEKLFPIDHYKFFKFPLETNKIIEFDADNETMSDKNMQDTRIHKGCEQIMRALTYLFLKDIALKEKDYRQIKSRSISEIISKKVEKGEFKKIENWPHETLDERQVLDYFEKTYLKLGKEHLGNIFDWLQVDIVIPLLVINENCGLIEVKYSEDKDKLELTDFEDKGYGLYYYVSENANKYSVVLEDSRGMNWFGIPIIICNLNYLEDCIKNIENSLTKLIEEVENAINKNPRRLLSEIIFPTSTKKNIKYNNLI